jgi:hypothetical protein
MHETLAEHPTPAQLRAFDEGWLHGAEWAAVAQHLSGCRDCARLIADLPERTLTDLLREHEPGRKGTALTAGYWTPAAEPTGALAAADVEAPADLADHPRYRLLGVLGVGGMGKVFKAEHRLMARVVALKVIHQHLLAEPAAVERFRLEVRAAARLAHPNIVTAHDAEQAGAAHFLVMEHVEGETLDRTLHRRGPLPVALACDLVRQAALGLQHAHERGMVHRDLKPSNLIVTPAGQVKILDFGLAQFGRQTQDRPALTPVGVVVGTPAYLAPEQARDPHGADIRADLYSLGCTLYHLLAGQPPFLARTLLQQVLAHQDQAPRPLSELRADVPPALARLVERLLAKDPSQRLQTPAELAEALAPFALGGGRGEGAPAGKTGRRRRVALVCLAVVLAAAVAAGVWYLAADRQDGPRPVLTGPTVKVGEPPGRPWSARPPARDQVVAWLKANNAFGPDHIIAADSAQKIDARVQAAQAFTLRLGTDLVRSGKPTLLAGRRHDFEVYEFSPEQVGSWLEPKLAVLSVSRPQDQKYHPRQLLVLSDLRLEPAGFGGLRPLTGSVAYRKLGPIEGPVALRLTCLRGHDSWWREATFPEARLADQGVLRFTFAALVSKGPVPGGALVGFLELGLWEGGNQSRVEVASNALTAVFLLEKKQVVRPLAAAGK